MPATGKILINPTGVFERPGPYAIASYWLGGGQINTASTGVLGLTQNDSSNLDFTQNGGYSGLYLARSTTPPTRATSRPPPIPFAWAARERR